MVTTGHDCGCRLPDFQKLRQPATAVQSRLRSGCPIRPVTWTGPWNSTRYCIQFRSPSIPANFHIDSSLGPANRVLPSCTGRTRNHTGVDDTVAQRYQMGHGDLDARSCPFFTKGMPTYFSLSCGHRLTIAQAIDRFLLQADARFGPIIILRKNGRKKKIPWSAFRLKDADWNRVLELIEILKVRPNS